MGRARGGQLTLTLTLKPKPKPNPNPNPNPSPSPNPNPNPSQLGPHREEAAGAVGVDGAGPQGVGVPADDEAPPFEMAAVREGAVLFVRGEFT